MKQRAASSRQQDQALRGRRGETARRRRPKKPEVKKNSIVISQSAFIIENSQMTFPVTFEYNARC